MAHQHERKTSTYAEYQEQMKDVAKRKAERAKEQAADRKKRREAFAADEQRRQAAKAKAGEERKASLKKDEQKPVQEAEKPKSAVKSAIDKVTGKDKE